MHQEDFSAFVRETGPGLLRAALFLTGDPDAAEDLLQSTYVRLYAAWPRVVRADNPLAYARRTLRNTFLSGRRRERELPMADPPDTVVPAADPGVRLDLIAALRTVAPLDRAVLVLRYLEDRSVADTAAELSLTELAVRSRSSRALAALRSQLIPEEDLR